VRGSSDAEGVRTNLCLAVMQGAIFCRGVLGIGLVVGAAGLRFMAHVAKLRKGMRLRIE
jgi:hypothetical protein